MDIFTLTIIASLVLFIAIGNYALGGFVNLVNPDITPSETVLVWAARNLVPEF